MINLSQLCDDCESILTATKAGYLRRVFVGRSRHRGVVLITLSACENLKPASDKPLRTAMVLERSKYEVRHAYGIAWWIMPLLAVIIEVIQWWMANHKEENK